jgi:hypothetical protein
MWNTDLYIAWALGIRSSYITRTANRTKLSHVLVLEKCWGVVALWITHPICATETGLPSGYTTITGCNLVISISLTDA